MNSIFNYRPKPKPSPRARERLRVPCHLWATTTALLLLEAGVVKAGTPASLSGRVLDSSGAPVPGATVILRRPPSRFERRAPTDAAGEFHFRQLAPGDYVVSAAGPGLLAAAGSVSLSPGDDRRLELRLAPGGFTDEVTVLASHIAGEPESLKRIPGSLEIVDSTTLRDSRAFNVNEALRKVSGVTVRDEEGFGLRPNIGIRGLNPTRSTKVLLLEDGVPLAYAPYGDNSSYYHPALERFESIEVLKGSGQIQYGPVTVGAVINYVTPNPPARPTSVVGLAAGNRDDLSARGSFGGTWGKTGLLLGLMRKQGDGARENTSSGLDDASLKLVSTVSPTQALTLKMNYYGEDSNVTYSGLRENEYRADPRQNPFRNDFFYGDRLGGAATHTAVLGGRAVLTTNLYAASFDRRWWRQSSNSNQRPNDAGDPRCGGMANLDTTCGNEGRLRKYATLGLEPKVRLSHSLFALRSEADFGVRVHLEDQDRLQKNGDTPRARRGVLVEDNQRQNRAYSAFFQNRFLLGPFTLTPGVRVERIHYQRTNRLANGGAGVTGHTALTSVVPGVGAALSMGQRATVFGGVHRGFAPPRTEDIINNTTGGAVELDPESSWNYEVGLRTRLRPGLKADATYFRMDYQNQIVPASLAGGLGATLTNGGETLHQGIEASARIDAGALAGSPHNPYLRLSYTWSFGSTFRGVRFSSVPGFAATRVTGNRLPYAPEHLLTASLGYSHPKGFHALVEAVYVGRQFADDLNTVTPSADGQRGLIPAYTVWNATVSGRTPRVPAALFVTVKNVFDRTFIVDRSRGILPSSPRLVQAGAEIRF